jgi:predicted MFS family arabinose efflux permease
MASLGSWRAAYWLIAAVAFASAAAFYFLHIDVPRVEKRRTDEGHPTPDHRARVIKLMLLLYAATMLSGFNYRSLMTALPTYLTAESAGVYSGTGKAHIVAIVFLIGGFGQYVSGRAADTVSPVRLYLGLIAFSVPLALLLALTGGLGQFAALTAMALALIHFSTQPAENILIASYSPAHIRSTSYGLKFLVTFGLGALGAPCVGFMWTKTGTLAWTFVVFAAVAVIVTTIILAIARTEATVTQHLPPLTRGD